MTGEDKELKAIRKRANRLARTLVAASDQFERIARLPDGPERSQVLGAIHMLSGAAMTWWKALQGMKRKRRRSPGTTAGWLGGW